MIRGKNEIDNNESRDESDNKIHLMIFFWIHPLYRIMMTSRIFKRLKSNGFHVRALADPEQPHVKRKILKKASVGEGIMSDLATLALPMMKTFLRMMQYRD
jgi:hypothetical protein